MARDVPGLHYVDEGSGRPVLLLHGNPTWSFLYREPIKTLAGQYRLIAPDYPGFGFSQAPHYPYSLPHFCADQVVAHIDELDLQNLVLVVHDWGGPIGLAAALQRPRAITGLVVTNSWCWPVDWQVWLFSLAVGNRLIRSLHEHFNLLPRWLMPLAFADRSRFSSSICDAYANALNTRERRRLGWQFVQSLRIEKQWLQQLEADLSRLQQLPLELVFGVRDPAFGRKRIIQRWQHHFPHTRVERVPDASHFLPEERPDRLTAAIERVAQRAYL
jgi:haloalkane dehalogenase